MRVPVHSRSNPARWWWWFILQPFFRTRQPHTWRACVTGGASTCGGDATDAIGSVALSGWNPDLQGDAREHTPQGHCPHEYELPHPHPNCNGHRASLAVHAVQAA
jgi:hypothetical protein